MDAEVAARLKELEQDGLAASTIVVYWGDHGVGLPRGKRWLYPAGLDVPLIVYVPERFRALAPEGYGPGVASDRLVSLLDLAPTMLSVAGIRPPEWMQGRAFMGPHAGPPRDWLAAGRDRMDERVDMSRAIRDGRHLYIRNFHPERAQGEYLAYMFETPTTQVWKARHDAGRLDAVQDAFWQEKSPEELYDLATDPDAVRNLAGDPAHASALARCRAALRAHLLGTRDLGLLPETDMHRRRGERTPYELAMDTAALPLERILDTADMATRRRPGDAARLQAGLADADPAVRYWSALGCVWIGADAVRAAAAPLQAAAGRPRPGAAGWRRPMLWRGTVTRCSVASRWRRCSPRRTTGATATMRRCSPSTSSLRSDHSQTRYAQRRPRCAEPGKDVPLREQEYVGRLKKAVAKR